MESQGRSKGSQGGYMRCLKVMGVLQGAQGSQGRFKDSQGRFKDPLGRLRGFLARIRESQGHFWGYQHVSGAPQGV